MHTCTGTSSSYMQADIRAPTVWKGFLWWITACERVFKCLWLHLIKQNVLLSIPTLPLCIDTPAFWVINRHWTRRFPRVKQHDKSIICIILYTFYAFLLLRFSPPEKLKCTHKMIQRLSLNIQCFKEEIYVLLEQLSQMFLFCGL